MRMQVIQTSGTERNDRKLFKSGRKDYFFTLIRKIGNCLVDKANGTITIRKGKVTNCIIEEDLSDHWSPFIPGDLAVLKVDSFDAVWINNKYQVLTRLVRSNSGDQDDILWLSIKTHDRDPVHDWRDLQRIKNDICGTSCTGIEIYPSRDRLVDTSNQYHLWVFRPGVKLPFGYQVRDVFHTQEEIDAEHGGCRQRDFVEYHKDAHLPEVGMGWKHYDENKPHL